MIIMVMIIIFFEDSYELNVQIQISVMIGKLYLTGLITGVSKND